MSEQGPGSVEAPKRKGNAAWFKGMESPNPTGKRRGPAMTRFDEAARFDGWGSLLTGVGIGSRDKLTTYGFSSDIISFDDAIEYWRGDDLAARAIEIVPSEMLREGYQIQIADDAAGKDKEEVLKKRFDALGVDFALWETTAFERAYGGGAILLGADDGAQDLTEPLNLDRIRSFEWVTPLEPREIMPLYYYANPRAPKFGTPAIYLMVARATGPSVDNVFSPVTLKIHESRLIRFPGIRVSRYQYATLNGGWGDSILTRLVRVLRDFNVGWSSAGQLVSDFSQAVFKIKGLAEIVAADNMGKFQARMTALDMSRSVARAALIDSEEEFSRVATPVTGLPELLDRFASRLSAATGMPLRLLMGQSPASLNAEGDTDIRNFYDQVAAMQRRKLEPAIRRIAEIAMRVEFGDVPEKWSVKFNPLWQPTQKEVAETRLAMSQADVGYVNAQVFSAEEIAVSRAGGGEYSLEYQIDLDARAKDVAPASPPVPPDSIRKPEIINPNYVPPPVDGALPDPNTPPLDLIQTSLDDATWMRVAMRMDVIEHRGDKWVVLTEDRTKVLGEHDSKEDAVKQLGAIEASKARARGDGSPDQPRDEHGRWAASAASHAVAAREHAKEADDRAQHLPYEHPAKRASYVAANAAQKAEFHAYSAKRAFLAGDIEGSKSAAGRAKMEAERAEQAMATVRSTTFARAGR